MMNIIKIQQFEYALSVFSEISHYNFRFVCEQGGKLFTGQFLSEFDVFPDAESYGEKFNRIKQPTNFDTVDFDVIKIRHLIFDKFKDGFSGRVYVPNTEDFVNAIYSLLDQVPDDLKPTNNFGIVRNVNFLESDLHFDSYRFPTASKFNVVSVQRLDN